MKTPLPYYHPFSLRHNAYVATRKDVKYKQTAIDKKEIKQVQPAEVVYKYKYNSKELQEELGLGVYDYGARIYDPAVPRFWSVDPLSEKYNTQSPYVYADNNPVLFRDILGMGTEDDYELVDGEVRWKAKREGEDRLYIDDKYETFSYGFLKNAGNIEKNGFETNNISDGIKLAKFVSFNYFNDQSEKPEIVGYAFSDNLVSNEPNKLRLLPFDNSEYKYAGVDGLPIGIDSGINLNFNENLPSDNHSISNEPNKNNISFIFHTHPFIDDGVDPSFTSVNGLAKPSRSDLNISTYNLYYDNQSVNYYIFGQKSDNNGNNASYYYPTNFPNFHSVYKMFKL